MKLTNVISNKRKYLYQLYKDKYITYAFKLFKMN